MIIANFEDENYKRVTGLWQWNYGQVLRIQGLNLPKAVEIHFSLQESGGEAKKRVGFTKDGVTDVVIPESMLENEESLGNYDIFAFIYLTDETSGQTEYKICMPVKARSKPEAFEKPEDEEIFREAITAVRESAERAETAEKQAAQHAEQTKLDAIKTGEDRTAITEMVESVSGIGEQVQAAKEYKDQAQTAATNALLSEQASEQAKEAALASQAGAESAADEAEKHALETAGDKVEVERLATQVRQDRTAVEQTKTAIDKTAQDFTLTAQQAVADVNNAGQSQTERVQSVGQTAVESVQDTKTQATQEVETTKTEVIKAVQEESTKQVEHVQAKGQEVINSIPEDFPTQMATKVDKQQGTENAGKLLGVGTDGSVALMGGASVGEILIADYTHRGNPEFHFADFDFATGIGTTTEPHGLTTATSVLICPNDFEVTNFTKNVMTLPIEWTMTGTGITDRLQLVPIDDTHLKLVAKTTQKIIPVNLEDISNKSVDIEKFHFEKPIAYKITNLDAKIKSKYIKVYQVGYCNYIGHYRYRRVNVRRIDGKIYDLPRYIDTLGFSFNGNSPAKNGVLQFSTTYVDLRGDTIYYAEDMIVGARRPKYENLIFDKVKMINNYIDYQSLGSTSTKIDAIATYMSYSSDYAYMSNGTRIQIYALEGEYKNES